MTIGYLFRLAICLSAFIHSGRVYPSPIPVAKVNQTNADLSALQQQIMLYRIKHKLPKITDYIAKHPSAVDWKIFSTERVYVNRTSRYVDPVLLALLLADDDLPSYPPPVIMQSNDGLSEEGLLNLAFIEMVTILGLAIISRSPTQLAPVIASAGISPDTASPHEGENRFTVVTDEHPVSGTSIKFPPARPPPPCNIVNCPYRDLNSQEIPDVLHVMVNFDGDRLDKVNIINEGMLDRTAVNTFKQGRNTKPDSKFRALRIPGRGQNNFRNAFDIDGVV